MFVSIVVIIQDGGLSGQLMERNGTLGGKGFVQVIEAISFRRLRGLRLHGSSANGSQLASLLELQTAANRWITSKRQSNQGCRSPTEPDGVLATIPKLLFK